jgi:hypothetical protein
VASPQNVIRGKSWGTHRLSVAAKQFFAVAAPLVAAGTVTTEIAAQDSLNQ